MALVQSAAAAAAWKLAGSGFTNREAVDVHGRDDAAHHERELAEPEFGEIFRS